MLETSFNVDSLSLFWCLPFVCILLSLAFCPVLIPRLWHAHYGKLLAFWTLLFMLPFWFYFGLSELSVLTFEALFEEYLPFVLLVLALFTVSGGIYIQGQFSGTTKFNLILLLIGTILASMMGTTGAAMLLIRPLLRANRQRKYKVHTVIFFIFLVANIGGGLTPLGDPPLFIGFLNSVPFSWTLIHMVLPVLLNLFILLVLYFFIDRFLLKKEHNQTESNQTKLNQIKPKIPFKIHGSLNLILLAGIIGAILFSGVYSHWIRFSFFGLHFELSDVIRNLILILIIFLSIYITPKQVRSGNEFNWEPMIEVAKLFIAIFITIVPVILILKAGENGALGFIVKLVNDHNQTPIPFIYFWLCGLLSGFLDNAPTYLIFFNLASGDANVLTTSLSSTLLAISMSSVFMGALTYIGNAPNLMVKNIALQSQIKMPSFIGYLKWSICVLIPLFLLDSLIFFCFFN